MAASDETAYQQQAWRENERARNARKHHRRWQERSRRESVRSVDDAERDVTRHEEREPTDTFGQASHRITERGERDHEERHQPTAARRIDPVLPRQKERERRHEDPDTEPVQKSVA